MPHKFSTDPVELHRQLTPLYQVAYNSGPEAAESLLVRMRAEVPRPVAMWLVWLVSNLKELKEGNRHLCSTPQEFADFDPLEPAWESQWLRISSLRPNYNRDEEFKKRFSEALDGLAWLGVCSDKYLEESMPLLRRLVKNGLLIGEAFVPEDSTLNALADYAKKADGSGVTDAKAAGDEIGQAIEFWKSRRISANDNRGGE